MTEAQVFTEVDGVRDRLGSWAAILFTVEALSGCTSVPQGRMAVDTVAILGTHRLDGTAIQDKIATKATPRLLFLFQGVGYDYEVLDPFTLQRDVARVERYAQARGFYEARVEGGRIIPKGRDHGRVEILVREGEPITVGTLRIEGLGALPLGAQTSAHGAARSVLREGAIFDEDAFAAAEGTIQRSLTDAGYAYAEVTRDAAVDLSTHRAAVVYTVAADKPAVLGSVTLEGLGNIPEDIVRRTLDLKPGEPYSTAELESAQQALLDLGVFSSVVVAPVLTEPRPERRVVPVTVTLAPARLRALTLGGGVELDAIKTDAHLLLRWEDKNVLGGLRHVRGEWTPGVVFYPTRLPSFQPPLQLMPEERLRIELRRPSFLEARTTVFVRPEFNVYPVLLQEWMHPRAAVLGYTELKGGVGLERPWGRRWFTRIAETVQWNHPFVYRGNEDPTLRDLVLSYPELLVTLDLRDDSLRPHEGLFLGHNLQVAGLGGQARDVKLQPEIRGYVPLASGWTLALRGTLGFLFPFNYGETVEKAQMGSVASNRDVQMVYFRGFFSGGPNSNRGYPPRTISPRGPVGFFDPALQAQQLAQSCLPDSELYDPARCAVPLGGLTLWETSVEVRVALSKPVAAVTFCDASDVAPHRMNLRFDRPHLSCGLGLRYDTPVGALRGDVAYRIPGLQVWRGTPEPVGTLIGDWPVSLQVGIGEAF